MIKYKYISLIKYAEAILSNSTQKVYWFEITEMLVAVFLRRLKPLRGLLPILLRGEQRHDGCEQFA